MARVKVFVIVLICIINIVVSPKLLQAQDLGANPNDVDLGDIGLGDIGVMDGMDGFGDFQGPGGFTGPGMDPVTPPINKPQTPTPLCEDGDKKCKESVFPE